MSDDPYAPARNYGAERMARADTSRPCLACGRYVWHGAGDRLCIACTREGATGRRATGRPGAPDPNIGGGGRP